MINHQCDPNKQKLKASDAALSPWLTSLSTFVAHSFRRYTMELTGVLQYIANELKVRLKYSKGKFENVCRQFAGWKQL